MKNRVYELRERKGWSLQQLAIKSGIDKSAINNFENGKTVPTARTLTCLARAFEVSVDELFEERKSVSIKKCDYPEKTKEQYMEEIQEVFARVETYKVRYFYIFIMAKLGIGK